MDNDKTDNINDKNEEFNKLISDFYGEDENVKDLSSTGLTTVPANIFKKFNLVKLDLSENNIRTLPMDMGELKNLRYLNISKNGFRCSNPDDTTILPRELTKLENLEYLNISENSLAFIPAIIWSLISLKSLDISRNKISVLPRDVGNLDRVEWLNCQHMGLTQIPDEIVGCQSLQTIILFGNRIITLPPVLADIPNLHLLALNMREMSSTIDNNTLSLLQSGQIRSDHISNTLFQLPAIQTLDLAFCNINYLKSFESSCLKELYIKGNYFKEIPEHILCLPNLELLDLSDNMIHRIDNNVLMTNSTSDDIEIWHNLQILLLDGNNLQHISGRIFQLPSLRTLNLNRNKLDQVEIILDNKENKLESLFLSRNKLKIFPCGVEKLKCLIDLDITNNQIHSLPLEMCQMQRSLVKLHEYQGLYKIGLWLLDNPIEFPPKHVWHTTNINHIFSYLERIKLQRINKKTPIRTVILGDDDKLKNKFLTKFLHLAKPTTPTRLLTLHRWKSPNLIPFVLLNISSNHIYKLLWKHFIDDNSLIFIVVKSDQCDFELNITKWLTLVAHNSKNCVVKIVKIDDTINSSEDNDGCNDENVDNYDDHPDNSMLKDNANSNENNSNEKEYDNSDSELINSIELFASKLEAITILPNIANFMINSENLSFNEFIYELEYKVVDTELFYEDTTIAILQDKANIIEKRCKSYNSFYLNCNEFVSETATELFMDEASVKICLSILQRQGKIFWFTKRRSLSDKIYPFIGKFVSGLMNLIRSDYNSELDASNNLLLKSESLISVEILQNIKYNFYNYGEISLPFYKILTIDSNKSLLIKDFLVDIRVCWTTPLLLIPEQSIFLRPFVVFPQMNMVDVEIDYLEEIIKENSSQNSIDFCAEIGFDNSDYIDEFYINIICAINDSVEVRYDWRNVVFACNEFGHLLISKTKNGGIIIVSNRFNLNNSSTDFSTWLNQWLIDEYWENIALIRKIDCKIYKDIFNEYL